MNTEKVRFCNLLSISCAYLMLIFGAGCIPPDPVFLSIEGDLVGLNPSESITLDLNAGEQQLPLFADGHFAFPVEVLDGSSYAVSVSNVPVGRRCDVSGGSNLDGSGTLAGSAVTDILVECTDILIADVYIPDQGLRDCVDDTALAADPDLLYVAELTSLDCDGAIYPITVTTGLEVFTALNTLAIYNNTTLASIDLGSLANLTSLRLILANLNAIDISENTALIVLYLQLNNLTTINLDANAALDDVQIELNCWDATTLNYFGGLAFSTFSYLPNRPDCSIP